MYIVTSIPIIKGIPKDSLTYFSTQIVRVGDIVTVQVKSREIKSVVTTVQDARSAKSEVKRGDFALKKVLKIEPGFIASSLIEVAKEVAEYSVTSVSKVLGTMLPKNVLINIQTNTQPSMSDINKYRYLEQAIEGSQKERFDWIQKNVITKNNKVLYVSPSNQELSKAKKFFKATEIICASPEQGFVQLPYVDTIILDHTSGAGYHDRSSAKIDFKKVYELHAKKNNQQIIFADSVLNLKYFAQDSLVQTTQDSPLGPVSEGSLVLSLSPWPKVTVVKKEKKVDHTSWLVSKEAVALVERVIKNGGQMFFFSPRKNVASMTLCGDCGEVVQCAKCKRSLTLAKKNGKQIFICPSCKETTSSDVKCSHCDSWKLSPLGVTVESVASELEKLFPKAHVLRISSDATKTKMALAKVIKQFYATSGAVLVGTELAIPYLQHTGESCVVSSLDSFLSGRSLSGADKAARIIFDIAEVGGCKVLVETSDPKQRFFIDLESGDLKKYRDCELAERKKFNYPPFSIIVKVGVETHFVKRENWPDKKIAEQIRALPKGISYEIDADRAV